MKTKITDKNSPRVAILVVLAAVGILAVAVAVIFLLTGRSETTIQGAIIGEPVSIELPVEESATVTHESGARIEVPAGATSASTTVSVAEVVPPESDLEVQRAFDFSVGAVQLLRPVTIHIPFDLETGADTSAVHALHWNEEAVDWEPVPGTVDESSRTISVTTSNLSVFSWAWVKVDANCDVNPGMVDVGEGFTVTAAGTSLTSGNIKIYMKPDLQGPFDLPDQPEAKSEIAVVGMGEQFQLNVSSALEIPAEHLIDCRIFWETIGPDVELTSQEPLAALLVVEGEGQFMYRVDLALEAVDRLPSPIYIGERFGIGLEVENLGEEPSIPFDLVSVFTSVVDGSVKRVDSIQFGHSQEVAVGAGESHLLKFDGVVPNDLLTGDYVVCVEIQHADASSRDLDTSNDRACLDKYVMHFVEGAMPIYTTLTETKAGHRIWTGVPSGSGLEPEAGLGFADDSGIRDDETLKKLYKRLAAELAFRKALQPEHGEQHVLLKGLMENVKGPTEIVGYINDFCGQLEIGCRTAMENTGLLDSGLMDKFPHASHEAIGFAGQSISGVLLFGDVYFSMLVNQALDMQQALDTLDELWHLPLGPVWKEAVEEARVEVAIMDSNRWNAQALEIVNSKDEIGKFAFTATVGGLTKYAIKKQLLHHLGIATQKALAHALGVKIAGGAAATTGVGGAAAAAGPVLFVASVWFAAEVYSDVQENQDQIGVATSASFLNAAFSDPSHKPELREAIAYAKYVAYDNFYKSDEGIFQDIASWITFSSGDRDEFLKYTDIERNKALEEVKTLVSVASVEVSPESLTLAVGDTEKLRGSATTGSGRNVSSQDFEWSSSAPGIAAVSEEGVVTGVAPGEAMITVSVGSIRSSARVSVDVDTDLPVEPPPTVTIGSTWTEQPLSAASPSPTPTPRSTPNISAGNAARDKEILEHFYWATGGDSWWTHYRFWLTNTDLAFWSGVRTNAQGRVQKLDMWNNMVDGQIPAVLGQLDALTYIDFGASRLSGNIPPELGELWQLSTMILYQNAISGKLPEELGNMPYLKRLIIHDNRLTGQIPVELGRATRLDEVDLQGNSFTGCLPSFLESISLDAPSLGLSWCQATPPERPSVDRDALVALFEATNGELWENNRNWLTDAPIATWYGVLTDDFNRVTVLSLRNNNLSGQIPAEIGELNALQILDLSRNDLGGMIPPELSHLSELARMFLDDNTLVGEIPGGFGKLAKLRYLSLSENRLSGRIPKELAQLADLKTLDLSRNELTSEIPKELGRMTGLVWLSLGENSLTGEIPAELGRLTNLERLNLQASGLSGQIPKELGKLARLARAQLSNNRLTGCIPANWWRAYLGLNDGNLPRCAE